MKTPTINSRVVKLEVLKGTATRTSVNAVESRTTSLEGDVATAQSDISTLQGDVATLTQGIQYAVSTHNTAPDAHADIRTALAGKQDAGSFAGSSTPGGAATTALACTGNAATATTAADSSRLGGQPPAYYAQASHVHSGYETAIGNPSVSGYLLSSTTAGVRSWVAPYSHPATHAQSVIDSSTGWITTALAGKQAAGAYLTTTGTAADSAKLGGVAASGYSKTSHTHNYAGSSSAGGAATTALACTGNAATATALATARTIKIGAKSLSFDGTTDREYTISDIGALGVPDVGSWTPDITSSTPPSGVTYYWRSGSYTRIGGVCYAWFGVSVSSLGSGGGSDLMLTGLPFVCRNTGSGTVWMPGGVFAGLVNAIDAYANAIGVNEGTNSAIFGRCNNLGMSAIPITDATNSLTVCGLIIYQTVA